MSEVLASDVKVEPCPSGWHAWTEAKQLHGFGPTREAALEQLKQFLVLWRRLEKRMAEQPLPSGGER